LTYRFGVCVKASITFQLLFLKIRVEHGASSTPVQHSFLIVSLQNKAQWLNTQSHIQIHVLL